MGLKENWETAKEFHHQRQARRRAEREAERQKWLERVRQAVTRAAATHPGVQQVYLYGSLVKPGRFGADSDIDLAVLCDALETESAFWRKLERDLGRDVDVRPLAGAIAEAATREGEKVYG